MNIQGFNKYHPELHEGEMFITNVGPDIAFAIACSWNSVRFGAIAYDVDGHAQFNLRPVFVMKSELQNAGVIDADGNFKEIE